MTNELKPYPDWEAFGRAIMEDWATHLDLDAADKFELAIKHGVLVEIEGGFDPDIHIDSYGGAEKGEPWYKMNTRPIVRPAVKALEWEGDFAHNNMGGFYHLDSAGGGIIALYFHTGSSKTGLAEADNIPELEGVANDHNEKRVLSCLEDTPADPWLPIEDIPDEFKDGRRVLVYVSKYGAMTAHFEQYGPSRKWTLHACLNREAQPTHVMPLPTPPTQQEKTDE
jgi:hypothetical protein